VLLHAATLTCRLSADEVSDLGNHILEREPATAAHAQSALPLVAATLIAADSVQGVSSWLSIEQQGWRQDLTVAEALVHVEQAMVLIARGRLVQAREHAERAMRLADTDWHEVGALSTIVLAAIALEVREPALSEQILTGAGRRRSASLALTAMLDILSASVDAQRGHWTNALDRLLACGRQLEASGWRNPALFPWRPWAISLHHRLGDTRSALALADEEHARAATWGAPATLGRALRLQGWLHGGSRGVTMLREAADTLRSSANQLELARTLVLLGRQLGDGAEAEATLREGGTLAATCGATWLVERAQCGQGTTQPETALTRTERRVAALASRGLTNQEIADELGVSSRAVEKHLTNSYRKLGITGRPGLVEAFAGTELADVR
jgi:DNA-binding CsgD family transcriptional regulator